MCERKLSVCIIVKNEEENLKKCLLALLAFPFEIVVVDTGSADRTVEVAKRYTEQVYDFAWCDDFAAAKNFAIQKASNDLVLVLDSDEYIEPMSEKELNAFLCLTAKNPAKVGRIKRRNFFSEHGERRESVEWINRIFSKSDFHYEGCIHEQVKALDHRPYETYLTGIMITHSGYDLTPEQKKAKARRNITLLQKELEMLLREEEHTDAKTAREETGGERQKQLPYLYYQLGKSFFMMEDYEEACKYFDQGLGFDLDPRAEYVSDMVESYGYALLNSGKQTQALAFEGIYDAFSYSADFLFLMGLIYMKNAKFEEAIQEFLRAAEKKEAKTVGTNSYLAWYNIGVIYECLDYKGEALAYYRKCGDYAKAKSRYEILAKK